jgi:hypothetical protein
VGIRFVLQRLVTSKRFCGLLATADRIQKCSTWRKTSACRRNAFFPSYRLRRRTCANLPACDLKFEECSLHRRRPTVAPRRGLANAYCSGCVLFGPLKALSQQVVTRESFLFVIISLFEVRFRLARIGDTAMRVRS